MEKKKYPSGVRKVMGGGVPPPYGQCPQIKCFSSVMASLSTLHSPCCPHCPHYPKCFSVLTVLTFLTVLNVFNVFIFLFVFIVLIVCTVLIVPHFVIISHFISACPQHLSSTQLPASSCPATSRRPRVPTRIHLLGWR